MTFFVAKSCAIMGKIDQKGYYARQSYFRSILGTCDAFYRHKSHGGDVTPVKFPFLSHRWQLSAFVDVLKIREEVRRLVKNLTWRYKSNDIDTL